MQPQCCAGGFIHRRLQEARLPGRLSLSSLSSPRTSVRFRVLKKKEKKYLKKKKKQFTCILNLSTLLSSIACKGSEGNIIPGGGSHGAGACQQPVPSLPEPADDS